MLFCAETPTMESKDLARAKFHLITGFVLVLLLAMVMGWLMNRDSPYVPGRDRYGNFRSASDAQAESLRHDNERYRRERRPQVP